MSYCSDVNERRVTVSLRHVSLMSKRSAEGLTQVNSVGTFNASNQAATPSGRLKNIL